MLYQYEAHIFRTSKGEHTENIHVAVSHLVMVPYDPDDNDTEGLIFPWLAIRCFSEQEANECAKAHHVTDIWVRGIDRAFYPPESALKSAS